MKHKANFRVGKHEHEVPGGCPHQCTDTFSVFPVSFQSLIWCRLKKSNVAASSAFDLLLEVLFDFFFVFSLFSVFPWFPWKMDGNNMMTFTVAIN